jgi:cytochrome c
MVRLSNAAGFVKTNMPLGQGNTLSDGDALDVAAYFTRCWDLLRQRRARRAAGLNPDDAQVRDEKTVEGYTA